MRLVISVNREDYDEILRCYNEDYQLQITVDGRFGWAAEIDGVWSDD